MALLLTLALGTAGVAAAADPQVTLSAEPRVVSFANSDARSLVLLTGSAGRANADLMLEAKQCGSPAFVAMRATHADQSGNFHEPDAPAISTTYRVRSGGALSNPVLVQVRPAIRFEQDGPARYAVQTIAVRFFRGAKGRFERFNRATGKWVLVRRVTLQRQSAPRGAGWAYSGATFTARVPKGTTVRFVLPRNQVGECYLAGFSVIFATTR